MYSRNMNRPQRSSGSRYTPPPGYKGHVFQDESTENDGLKHHLPDRVISREPEKENMAEDNVMRRPPDSSFSAVPGENSGIRESAVPQEESGVTCRGENRVQVPAEQNHAEKTVQGLPLPLKELLASLRGKIGAEELIILLVMLLIASEGIGAEVLILAVSLLAGTSG